MKLLSPRQVKRLKGRDLVILNTGVQMARLAIKNLTFIQKIKFILKK